MTRLIMCFVIFVSIIAISKSQTTYRLACSGMSPDGGAPYVLLNGDGIRIFYTFAKGTGSFSSYSGNMPHGTCTWLDRGLNVFEPNVLVYNSTSPSSVYCMSTSNKGYTCHGNSGSIEQTILNLGQSSIPMTKVFNVYNNGQGRMVVTSLGSL